MDDILNFINSVETESANDAKNSFAALMQNRIADEVENVKTELAASIFNTSEVQDNEAENAEIDLSDEELEDILQKIEDTEKEENA
jgi:hypothetical protein